MIQPGERVLDVCSFSTTWSPAQLPDLQLIHQRIKDNIEVLQNFGAKREEGRSRQEYLTLLRQDLSAYYSYSDFLIGKMMDLFPLSEVLFFLDQLMWCPINSFFPILPVGLLISCCTRNVKAETIKMSKLTVNLCAVSSCMGGLYITSEACEWSNYVLLEVEHSLHYYIHRTKCTPNPFWWFERWWHLLFGGFRKGEVSRIKWMD